MELWLFLEAFPPLFHALQMMLLLVRQSLSLFHQGHFVLENPLHHFHAETTIPPVPLLLFVLHHGRVIVVPQLLYHGLTLRLLGFLQLHNLFHHVFNLPVNLL